MPERETAGTPSAGRCTRSGRRLSGLFALLVTLAEVLVQFGAAHGGLLPALLDHRPETGWVEPGTPSDRPTAHGL